MLPTTNIHLRLPVKNVRGVKMMLALMLAADVLIIAISVHMFFRELERRTVGIFGDCPVAAVPVIKRKKKAPAKKTFETLIFDDFALQGSNRRGGQTQQFSGSGGTCARRQSEGAVRLDYDVAAQGAYAGYWSMLNGIDLRGYRRLSFYARSEAGKERFKIELGDGKTAAKVPVNTVLLGGITSGWQKISVPLELFGALDHRDMRGNFAVVFENSQGGPLSGVIYIKDIRFEK